MRIIHVVFLILMSFFSFSQECMDINKGFFQYIHENVPDQINCKDSLGRKQGLWFYYKSSPEENIFFPKPINGINISEYQYGVYDNDVKIGSWLKVYSIPHDSHQEVIRYYYAEDTVLINRVIWHGPRYSIYLNSDSTIIKYNCNRYSYSGHENISLDIHLNKSIKDSCEIQYKGKIIKYFHYNDLNLELQNNWTAYGCEVEEVDMEYHFFDLLMKEHWFSLNRFNINKIHEKDSLHFYRKEKLYYDLDCFVQNKPEIKFYEDSLVLALNLVKRKGNVSFDLIKSIEKTYSYEVNADEKVLVLKSNQPPYHQLKFKVESRYKDELLLVRIKK